MDVFHVEVVRRDGIGHRVLGQYLRLLDGIGCHELRIKLDRVVAEFRCCDSFQALTALRKVRVSLNPSSNQ